MAESCRDPWHFWPSLDGPCQCGQNTGFIPGAAPLSMDETTALFDVAEWNRRRLNAVRITGTTAEWQENVISEAAVQRAWLAHLNRTADAVP